MAGKPIVPPFSEADAVAKVRAAEDLWNTRDPEKVAAAYAPDSRWRNRTTWVRGHDEIVAFLTQKWDRERDYRLIKEMWSYGGNRIAVRFASESMGKDGLWYRSYGNEQWEFDENGRCLFRHASINDLQIGEDERLYHWEAPGPRPEGHPGLTDLGL
ncbi:nuclear transport factor 2 family protein [uncultured Microbacterium sp.]|uniref:nuclear transport factor 2 family protein n=1 Tax=uncultured Microbacterium sp. TaxID=191216 RepID=UPI003459C898